MKATLRQRKDRQGQCQSLPTVSCGSAGRRRSKLSGAASPRCARPDPTLI